MRLFMDAVVALMLLALLAGVVWYNKQDNVQQKDRETARSECRRFQQQIALQSALARGDRNERGYPETIDPAWFQGVNPNNPLVNPVNPWVQVAGPEHKYLLHPPDPVCATKSIAKFWYNPYMGVVRARVPSGFSDAASLELYNFINDCQLTELFPDGSDSN